MKTFYNDINIFNENSKDILEILQDYNKKFNDDQVKITFFSALFENNILQETNIPILKAENKCLKKWVETKSKIRVSESILDIELGNNLAFLAKDFDLSDEKPGSFVLAGYIVKTTINFRIYIAEKIDENYSVLLKKAFSKIHIL